MRTKRSRTIWRTLGITAAIIIVAGIILYTQVLRGALVGYGPSDAPVSLDTLTLPDGFTISVFANDTPGARSLTRSDAGIVYVGTRKEGVVYALTPNRGESRAEETTIVARGLTQPNGVAWRDGDLYIVEPTRVLVLRDIDNALSNPPAPKVLFDSIPGERGHEWRYAAFGPDGLLYIAIGMPCNVCERPDPYGTIVRLNVENPEAGYEVVARGIRNSVGFAWHPQTKDLWLTDNGRDWLGENQPGDELNHVPARDTPHFGFPYCHAGTLDDPDFNKRTCSEFTAPVQVLGPHVAALGMAFVPESWPAPYAGSILIAEHGSWNRQVPIGYRVMFVPLQGAASKGYEPFATGWLNGSDAWGRPVDVLFLADQSMLVSDDKAGVVYRVSVS
jgi:glucose/arabinose dehydrogenase